MPVTHNHQSSTPNNPAHEISSTRWNAAHTVSITNADVSASAAIAESKLALNFPTRAAVTPGGSNTNVQYNNTGTFAGSNNFTWDEGNTRLTLGGTSTGYIYGGLHSSGLALGLALVGGDSESVDGNGGRLDAYAGTGAGFGEGGDFSFGAGDGGDVGRGGNARLEAGDATDGPGGNIYLRPGYSDTLQHGKVIIEAAAGDVTFDASILSNSRTYTLPDKDGTLAMLDDTAPGGDSTQIQFNSTGTFAGSSNLTWEESVTTLTIGGDLRFPASSDGVILSDRTTGSLYRLYVDSGALLIEVVV